LPRFLLTLLLVRALPGVLDASCSTFTFSEGGWNNPVYVQGFDNDKSVNVKHNVVGKDYFATMGIPIIAGRGFRPQDTATSPKVAVISAHMAQTMFPGGSPIGRHYGIGGQQNAGEFEVIGVAGDVKFNTLDEATETLDYYPYVQGAKYLKDFELRYTGDLGTITVEVRNAIRAIDPNLPITSIETLDQRLANSVSGQRAVAQLCTFFGLLAVFLSSIGVYGLMSYLVSRRTNEIGIRIALGADRWHVRGLVMREIILMVAASIAVGVPVTLGGERIVTSMLYGLSGYDSFSLVGAAGLLLLVVLLAAHFPVRRASRIDPAVALRCE